MSTCVRYVVALICLGTLVGQAWGEESESPVTAHLGLLGGISINAPESGYDAAVRPSLAADGDVSTPYFGIEAEGFYSAGVGPTTNNESEPEEWGTFVNFKVTAPLHIESGAIIPKIGLGYAFMGEANEDPENPASSISGGFFVFGVEVEQKNLLFVDLDYALSLGVNGADSAILENGQTDSPHFYRARIAASYRIADHWLVGAEFLRHGVTLPAGTAFDSNPVNESHLETLGILRYQF